MKKETLILLAVLGIVFYNQYTAKQKKQLEQSDAPITAEEISKIFRKLYEKHKDMEDGNTLIIEEAYTIYGEPMGFAKEQIIEHYEIFRQNLDADPNFGL